MILEFHSYLVGNLKITVFTQLLNPIDQFSCYSFINELVGELNIEGYR